jgi:2'-5' RNA ligase
VARDRASRPEAKPLRLFVAADVPEEVRSRLAETIAPVRERHRGRWPPPQNWHLTLKFLGATWPRLVEWVEETCAEIAGRHESFVTSLTELGAFPNPRRARVLWAGLDDPSSRFAAIASSLDEALASEFKPEQRPFTAHLTVARFDPPVALAAELLTVDVPSETFGVDHLTLYRSHLQRPAPRYEELGRFPLTKPPGAAL